jgi:hypothetical protein
MMAKVAACTTGEKTAAIPKSPDDSQKMQAQFLSNIIGSLVSKRCLLYCRSMLFIVSTLFIVPGLGRFAEMLHFELAVGIDRADQRALEATLQIELDAATGYRTRHLDQSLMGRAECVPLLRTQLQRHSAGTWGFAEFSRLRIDVDYHAGCAFGDGTGFLGRRLGSTRAQPRLRLPG